MFSHCFTGVFMIHLDLLPQPHSAFFTSLLHCLWASLDYIFQLSVHFYGWLANWQHLCFCTSCRVTSPSLHPGYLEGFFGYRTYLPALWWELFTFGECWDALVSLSPCLPSQHIPPAVLTHPYCPQVHSVFPPPPLMSSNPSQVSTLPSGAFLGHTDI